ncbi:MAG: hypothetical protein AB7U05_00890 [Mangrovibacterium sp.]
MIAATARIPSRGLLIHRHTIQSCGSGGTLLWMCQNRGTGVAPDANRRQLKKYIHLPE